MTARSGWRPGEFERVDRLLVGSLKTLGAWRWSMGYPSRGQLTRSRRRRMSTSMSASVPAVRRCAPVGSATPAARSSSSPFTACLPAPATLERGQLAEHSLSLVRQRGARGRCGG